MLRGLYETWCENYITFTLIIIAAARMMYVLHRDRVNAQKRRRARFEQGHRKNMEHKKAIALKEYCRSEYGKDTPMQVFKDKYEGYKAWVVFLTETREELKKEASKIN